MADNMTTNGSEVMSCFYYQARNIFIDCVDVEILQDDPDAVLKFVAYSRIETFRCHLDNKMKHCKFERFFFIIIKNHLLALYYHKKSSAIGNKLWSFPNCVVCGLLCGRLRVPEDIS